MSGRDRRDDLSRHWLLTSMVGGMVGVLYPALSLFGWDAWTSTDLLIGLAGMIVLLIPAGAAIGLMWGLMLWALLSPLAARRRKASGRNHPEGRPSVLAGAGRPPVVAAVVGRPRRRLSRTLPG